MAIELWAYNTPNGRKISVALEEMGLPYTVRVVDITKGEQHAPEFLRISPNNRIPAIIDPAGPNGGPISVFESGAILLYLGQKVGRFWPTDLGAQVPVLEWLMWQMGGLGPMPGQVHHFLGVTNEQDRRYGLARYAAETNRLYGVADRKLAEVEFRVRTDNRRFRDPRLGVAARTPSGEPRRLSECRTLVRHDDGSARGSTRPSGSALLTTDELRSRIAIVSMISRR
jgi:GST-like protein